MITNATNVQIKHYFDQVQAAYSTYSKCFKKLLLLSISDVHHEKTELKVFVVVIPKEG